MTARIPLGARVKVAHIYEMPDVDSDDLPEEVRMAPVPNPKADQVGVVVGKSRRRVCKRLEPESDVIPMGPYVRWTEETALFYVVKYTLTGRGYLTLPEFMEVVRI